MLPAFLLLAFFVNLKRCSFPLNVCVPSKSICQNLTPSVTELEAGPRGDDQATSGEPSRMGPVSWLPREAAEPCPVPPCEGTWKTTLDGHRTPQSRALELLHLQNWEK